MTGFIITIHALVCILLIAIILVQRGRGGGLVESFSGVESMFGTKTTAFLTRLTTVLSILFFVTCLSLAVLSARQSRSLMRQIKTETPAPQSKTEPSPEQITQEAVEKMAGQGQTAPQGADPQ